MQDDRPAQAIELEAHPFAKVFPPIEGAARAELKADIEAHGVMEDIVLHPDGRILDGLNRYAIAREVGATFATRTYTGDDPLRFVLSANLHRRHLDPSQRAMIADRLANMPQGRPGKTATMQVKRADAAALLNVSERSIASAAIVREHGATELRTAVERGHIPVSTAAHIASEPAERQQAIIADLPRDADGRLTREARAALAPIIREVRAEKVAEKIAARVEREATLGARLQALPEKRYAVILADPEWLFRTSDSGSLRAAVNHYPVSPLEVIKARDVASIAAPDCALFLWATSPMLPHALEVMEAWDFAYKSGAVWVKDRVGTGYWFRNRHELLLVGTRGNIPAPAMGDAWDSVIEAPTGRHSEKPSAIYELIESYYPSLPKIELNARTARPGWDRWGNEAPPTAADDT